MLSCQRHEINAFTSGRRYETSFTNGTATFRGKQMPNAAGTVELRGKNFSWLRRAAMVSRAAVSRKPSCYCYGYRFWGDPYPFPEFCGNQHIRDPTWNQNPFLNRLENESRRLSPPLNYNMTLFEGNLPQNDRETERGKRKKERKKAFCGVCVQGAGLKHVFCPGAL